MKTPEEIKKGLLHCEREKCKGCPYYDKCMMADAHTDLHTDALEYIQQLEMQHGKDTNVHRWISVEERLPEDGIDVIVYTDRCGGNVEYAYYRHDICAWFKDCILLIYNVTHWMPLPAPPKEE